METLPATEVLGIIIDEHLMFAKYAEQLNAKCDRCVYPIMALAIIYLDSIHATVTFYIYTHTYIYIYI